MSDPKPSSTPDSRREFLRRVLRTTAYVPPAVIALGMGNLAAAQATMMMFMMMISDQDLKTAISPVDGRRLLDRLAGIAVSEWSYKGAEASTRHIGPMAQDFRRAFEVGSDERFIHAVDANGVALASIQALYAMVLEQKETIARLESRLAEFERRG